MAVRKRSNRIQRAVAKSPLAREVFVKAAAGYVALHLGRPSSWFIRLVWGTRRKAVVVRLSAEQVLATASAFDVAEVPEGCRVLLNSPGDLAFLRPLILRAFEVEAGKVVA
jgi:hypothetical protein